MEGRITGLVVLYWGLYQVCLPQKGDCMRLLCACGRPLNLSLPQADSAPLLSLPPQGHAMGCSISIRPEYYTGYRPQRV
mgnify:CR=1 FL=1